MALVNMKMSKEEAQEYSQPSVDEGPRYPYGLSINLDDDAIEKLGCAELNVGDEVTIVAKATVTNKSGYQTLVGDSESSMGLQLTDMELGGDGSTKATKALYDKK